jgi:hypothetical protein
MGYGERMGYGELIAGYNAEILGILMPRSIEAGRGEVMELLWPINPIDWDCHTDSAQSRRLYRVAHSPNNRGAPLSILDPHGSDHSTTSSKDADSSHSVSVLFSSHHHHHEL